MAVFAAIVAGFVFGAADQYLGSLVTLGPWAYSVSVMSAPWLALPFAFGATQRNPRRAMVLGLVVTAAGLAGYFVMTLSPVEGVPVSRFAIGFVYLARAQMLYIIGGAITGPLFGYLGHRWRLDRSWTGAALTAAALCLEPFARVASGQLSPPNTVWLAEVAAGLCLATYFVIAGVTHRQQLRRSH